MSGRGPRWISVKKTPSEFTISIKGTLNATYGYVTIDGTQYSAAAEVVVAPNTPIEVMVGTQWGQYNNSCQITLNGTVVQSGYGSYQFNAEADATITFTKSGGTRYYFTCAITTS